MVNFSFFFRRIAFGLPDSLFFTAKHTPPKSARSAACVKTAFGPTRIRQLFFGFRSRRRRGFGFLLFSIIRLYGRGRCTGFFCIISYIPSSTLQMEAALGNKLVHLPGTISAFFQRFIGKFLNNLVDAATFFTFILVDRHCWFDSLFSFQIK